MAGYAIGIALPGGGTGAVDGSGGLVGELRDGPLGLRGGARLGARAAATQVDIGGGTVTDIESGSTAYRYVHLELGLALCTERFADSRYCRDDIELTVARDQVAGGTGVLVGGRIWHRTGGYLEIVIAPSYPIAGAPTDATSRTGFYARFGLGVSLDIFHGPKVRPAE